MAELRVHAPQPSADPALSMSLCAIAGSKLTDDWDAVTCLLCLRRRPPEPAPPFEPSGPYERRRGCTEPLVVDAQQAKPPWLHELHALRELVQAEDAGFRVKSSSEPSRFGRRGTGGSAHPEGDLAQRRVERLAPVIAARQQAFTTRWVLSADPFRALSPELCTHIMVWYLVGRRSDRRLTYDRAAANPEHAGHDRFWKKHRVSERIRPGEAKEIARWLTAELGWAVSDYDVGRIARAGRHAMREYLRERGLIPRLVFQHEGPAGPEESDMGAAESFDLDGWKEIADVIGEIGGKRVHERTARDYASRLTDPLPVYVGLGRVVAKREEVVAWVRRQFVPMTSAQEPSDVPRIDPD